jgi:hypothetical protein
MLDTFRPDAPRRRRGSGNVVVFDETVMQDSSEWSPAGGGEGQRFDGGVRQLPRSRGLSILSAQYIKATTYNPEAAEPDFRAFHTAKGIT